MASGFQKAAQFRKAHSTRSLGSFVDISSAASSEFEPVDLEELSLETTPEMSSQEEGDFSHSHVIEILLSSIVSRIRNSEVIAEAEKVSTLA